MKKYWKSFGELERSKDYLDSLHEQVPSYSERVESFDLKPGDSGESAEFKTDRRDFLKTTAAVAAAATLYGCARGPEQHAKPLARASETVVAGLAYYYATTCGGCNASCGVIVKNRDGRPIKMEGNPDHPISKGGLCSVGQAQTRSLYDSERLKKPRDGDKEVGWDEAVSKIRAALSASKNGRGSVRIVSSSFASKPRDLAQKLVEGFAAGKVLEWDAVSYDAIRNAHKLTHDVFDIPQYKFDRANYILSFDADFLGTWISPVEFSAGYAERRRLHVSRTAERYDSPERCRHVQVEPAMSMTGSNADLRVKLLHGDFANLLSLLIEMVQRELGTVIPASAVNSPVDQNVLDNIVSDLMKHRGKSLVISGSDDVEVQRLVNVLNHHLENYEKTVVITEPDQRFRSDDAAIPALITDLAAGSVDVVIFSDTNPVYAHPRGKELAEAIKNAGTSVSISTANSETAAACGIALPLSHFLESWGMTQPVPGLTSMSQPALHPLFDTRSFTEIALALLGDARSHYDYLQGELKTLEGTIQLRPEFTRLFDQIVHDGFFQTDAVKTQTNVASLRSSSVGTRRESSLPEGTLELTAYSSVMMRDGKEANNPWLQEGSDPVTKTTWGNYALLSKKYADAAGIRDGDIVKVSATEGDASIEVPALAMPGQHEKSIAIAIGYGRKNAGKYARGLVGRFPEENERETVGANVFVFGKSQAESNGTRLKGIPVKVEKTGAHVKPAQTQEHASIEHRPIVLETTFSEYEKNPKAGNEHEHELGTLWSGHDYSKGYHWGLAIDLSVCTGCSACIISCQSENNIPVVGEEEIRTHRSMQWLKIDRYFSDDADNPGTVHQPMMCQQCDNAPCETVCPVMATSHSDEGLNDQAYNRCVGTRYCANNCPYKARRFNWFTYPREDPIENLVLNPDIGVRTRGVMEKCTFCVQRIQDAKSISSREGRKVRDGEIQTACQQSCPTSAIVFGDMNDKNGRVSKLMDDPRRYKVLEEIGVLPSVGYLTKVRHDSKTANGGEGA
ncbi:MAG: TAT-variant-translocated molybdopterin oxidoreductase [Planctomycetes bacterium]|nr:TAT-variant-translocated molybdopterin oxidoreductase [Planctomycetota bacterium]